MRDLAQSLMCCIATNVAGSSGQRKDYWNLRISNVNAVGVLTKMCQLSVHDVREYEALIQCASSHKDAVERLN